MFRALALLLILAGNPQYLDNNLNLQNDVNLIEVKNFQYIQKTDKQPLITAEAVLAFDEDTFLPLYQKNVNKKRPVASLAKLMTVLIVMEENHLDEIVTISQEVNAVKGSKMWLYPNEKITVENLIKGMLINSGNDAAIELAKYNAGSLEKFAEKTKAMGIRLGLKNSQFMDPSGLDDEKNYSTAGDLAIIVKSVLKYDFIKEIIQTKKETVYSIDKKQKHYLTNTNRLLGSYLEAKGLKTGTTYGAGQCLITLVSINGNDVVIILLGSQKRYVDTKTIYYHILHNL